MTPASDIHWVHVFWFVPVTVILEAHMVTDKRSSAEGSRLATDYLPVIACRLRILVPPTLPKISLPSHLPHKRYIYIFNVLLCTVFHIILL
jgi:hypothetical protein